VEQRLAIAHGRGLRARCLAQLQQALAHLVDRARLPRAHRDQHRVEHEERDRLCVDPGQCREEAGRIALLAGGSLGSRRLRRAGRGILRLGLGDGAAGLEGQLAEDHHVVRIGRVEIRRMRGIGGVGQVQVQDRRAGKLAHALAPGIRRGGDFLGGKVRPDEERGGIAVEEVARLGERGERVYLAGREA
jgi:hypothetical protein